MKVLLIGRHTPVLPSNIDVVEQRAVTFPATSRDCISLLSELGQDAVEMGASGILFQGVPAQVIPAIYSELASGLDFGFVINQPGERLPDETFVTSYDDEKVIIRVNPRAKITDNFDGTVTVHVSKPMRFELSHIEWL